LGNAHKILRFPVAAARRATPPVSRLTMAQVEKQRRKALNLARQLFAEGKLDQAAEQEIVLELARLLVVRRQDGARSPRHPPAPGQGMESHPHLATLP